MRKGQAAMEFLMTYGWAILVVIAAIAALAYFGVLDPARLLPERCQFPAGMDCVDKANILTTDVTIALRNNVGFAVDITAISGAGDFAACTGSTVDPDGPGALPAAAVPQTVQNNAPFIIVWGTNLDCGLTAGDRIDGEVTVTYTNTETGVSHDVVGEIRGRAA